MWQILLRLILKYKQKIHFAIHYLSSLKFSNIQIFAFATSANNTAFLHYFEKYIRQPIETVSKLNFDLFLETSSVECIKER